MTSDDGTGRGETSGDAGRHDAVEPAARAGAADEDRARAEAPLRDDVHDDVTDAEDAEYDDDAPDLGEDEDGAEAPPVAAESEADAPVHAGDEDEPDDGEAVDPSSTTRDSENPAGRPDDAPPPPETADLPARIEALLFVSDQAVEEAAIARALGVTRRRVERALDALAESLRSAERGIRLQRGPDGAALVTAPEASPYIEYFLGLEASRRLSTAALETLAIVAYRQPVTRGTIDRIRGVSSDGAVATLRARGLIVETGRAEGPGRPVLWGTTQRFLEHFGLERPGELPPLPEDVELPEEESGTQLSLEDAGSGDDLAALSRAAGAALGGRGARGAAEAADAGDEDESADDEAAPGDANDADGGAGEAGPGAPPAPGGGA